MADKEYKEPTNEQLVNFLSVYLPAAVGLGEGNAFLPELLALKLEEDPAYREAALRHHKQFVEDLGALHKKMESGKLQCEHIRGNSRKCPNFNEPGSFYCGLHKVEEME